MTSANAFRIAAVLGFLGVALGAFGAHGLKTILAQHGTAAIWEKATLYHLVHAVVLLVIASRPALPVVAWWLFATGIVIFSGTLYVLALSNVRWFGAITPLGGLSLLAGWLALVFAPAAAAPGGK